MRAFDKIDISIGQVFVNVLLKGVVDDFVWACTAYMVPNDNNQRGAL